MRRRRLRGLTSAVAVFATGMALSQAGVSSAAFSALTGSGAESWSAGSVQPVSGLTGAGSCGTSTKIVELAWEPSTSSFATGYSVLRDGVAYAEVSDGSTSTWTDAVPASGEHTYAVIAKADSWRSDPVSVTVATPVCGPTVALDPVPAYVSGTVTVTATASSDDGITSVSFQWAVAGSTTWNEVCRDTAAPWSCSRTTDSGDDGVYDLRAIATDSTGASAVSALVRTTVDNTAPTVTMDDPGSPLVGTVTLSATADDTSSGVASVAFQIRPTGGSTWAAACSASVSPWSCTYDTSLLPAGFYDVRAVATDGAGNVHASAAVTNRQVVS